MGLEGQIWARLERRDASLAALLDDDLHNLGDDSRPKKVR